MAYLFNTKPIPRIPDTDLPRFTERITKAEDSGCWKWTGAIDGGGYGMFSMKGVGYKAHRVAYRHYVGVIRKGLTIDHLCRTRSCVNPAHLEPVTSQENTRRQVAAARRRRGYKPKRTYAKFVPTAPEPMEPEPPKEITYPAPSIQDLR